jgi:hypothetical protein
VEHRVYGEGRVSDGMLHQYMEKAEYMQREWRRKSIWRRQSICRENGEGKLYAEYMEKAEYMQRMTEAGDGNLNQ